MRSFIPYLVKLDVFYGLIRKKSTGSVQNISEILEVSESTVKRMVKHVGHYKKVEIEYCRKKSSYIVVRKLEG